MKIIKVSKKILYTLLLISLLITNILSITNSKFHDALSSLLSKVPISNLMSNSKSEKLKGLISENKNLQQQNASFKSKENSRKKIAAQAHIITKRIAFRAVKTTTVNVASVIPESIPYLGVGVILAVTASDIYDGCATMKDTNELLFLLNSDPLINEEKEICGMNVPNEKQVLEQLGGYKSKIKDVVGGTIYEIFN